LDRLNMYGNRLRLIERAREYVALGKTLPNAYLRVETEARTMERDTSQVLLGRCGHGAAENQPCAFERQIFGPHKPAPQRRPRSEIPRWVLERGFFDQVTDLVVAGNGHPYVIQSADRGCYQLPRLRRFLPSLSGLQGNR
jgi:hypothetical protein